MRARWLTPLALLPAGCVTTMPHMPSVQAQHFAEDVPLAPQWVPSASEVIDRWSLPIENPWSPFAKLTLVTVLTDKSQELKMPAVERSSMLREAMIAGGTMGQHGLPGRTMFVVDLPGAESVSLGVALSKLSPQPVSLIPMFQNWPYDNELVPASETLAAMVKFMPLLPAPSSNLSGPPIFLLDAWRLAYANQSPPAQLTDNRYALAPSDLPTPEQLHEHGIQRVVYIVETKDGRTAEEDDLNAPFLRYQEAGIPISFLSLDDLESGADVTDWSYRHEVYDRTTILQDPNFYVRARAGFGGWFAGAVAVRSGGVHGGFSG
jgi:hypothetical protein